MIGMPYTRRNILRFGLDEAAFGEIAGEIGRLVLDCDGVDVMTHELIGDVITASTNGTQINGVSITDAELRDGNEIRFGYVTGVGCNRKH